MMLWPVMADSPITAKPNGAGGEGYKAAVGHWPSPPFMRCYILSQDRGYAIEHIAAMQRPKERAWKANP
jgi:hypothetical protein